MTTPVVTLIRSVELSLRFALIALQFRLYLLRAFSVRNTLPLSVRK
ncbi:MAG: hypothetical protein AAGA38_04475 [Pseudomonadota bacterium]